MKSAVPLSIVAAGALIGAGLYFGLRERPRSAMSPPTSAPGPAQAEEPRNDPKKADVSAPKAPPPSKGLDELRASVTRQAQAALEAQRAQFVAKCWNPLARGKPGPARCRYDFNLTISAEGKEIARGISEERGNDRPEVGQCLRSLFTPIVVEDPAGVSVPVSLTLYLPN